jgi:hypothetical protein
MKKLLFVSTGRCGTKRIAQILRIYLPEEFSVVHQMPLSRLTNFLGNLFFYSGASQKIKQFLYHLMTAKYCQKKHFICSDPLTSMIIPNDDVHSQNVCIVHIERDPEAFAESFFRLSRRRLSSFIAHNFIPLWQIGLWPLENLLNPAVKRKYMKIAEIKNNYFIQAYSSNPNYKRIGMETIFSSNFLNDLIYDFFRYTANIPTQELKIKAN